MNSDDPFFLAAECFKDTLMEKGVPLDTAESARVCFLALKKDKKEELQDKISSIASKVQLDDIQQNSGSKMKESLFPAEEDKNNCCDSNLQQDDQSPHEDKYDYDIFYEQESVNISEVTKK